MGNYFNQELFGKPTNLIWGLEIDEKFRPFGYEVFQTFHPTFLYELIWNIFVGFLLIYLDRKYRIGHGRLFSLYVVFYSVGRLFVENLRIDEARQILGLRFNVWTCLVVILGGLVYFVLSNKLRPGREDKLIRS